MGTMLGGVFTAPGWGLVGTRVALALTNYRENYYFPHLVSAMALAFVFRPYFAPLPMPEAAGGTGCPSGTMATGWATAIAGCGWNAAPPGGCWTNGWDGAANGTGWTIASGGCI